MLVVLNTTLVQGYEGGSSTAVFRPVLTIIVIWLQPFDSPPLIMPEKLFTLLLNIISLLIHSIFCKVIVVVFGLVVGLRTCVRRKYG